MIDAAPIVCGGRRRNAVWVWVWVCVVPFEVDDVNVAALVRQLDLFGPLLFLVFDD